MDEILMALIKDDKNILLRRDELIGKLDEKVPANLRRDYSAIRKALELNVGEIFAVGNSDRDSARYKALKVLASSGLNEQRIDFVIKTFSRVLGWNENSTAQTNSLIERVENLESTLANVRAENANLKSQMLIERVENLERTLANVHAENANLKSQIDALNKRLQALENRLHSCEQFLTTNPASTSTTTSAPPVQTTTTSTSNGSSWMSNDVQNNSTSNGPSWMSNDVQENSTSSDPSWMSNDVQDNSTSSGSSWMSNDVQENSTSNGPSWMKDDANKNFEFLDEYNALLKIAGVLHRIKKLDEFIKKFSVKFISCEDVAERMTEPTTPPIFKYTYYMSEYFAIPISGNQYAILPNVYVYNDNLHNERAMGEVFYSNFVSGYSYENISVKRPAIFECKGDAWTLKAKGELNLS